MAVAAKKHAKVDIKLFLSCPVILDLSILYQIPCPGLWLPDFSLKQQFWFFEPSLPKRVFPVKNKKREHHRWIVHIQVSLDTKFQLKITVLIFWTEYAQKWYFQTKMENHTCVSVHGCYLITTVDNNHFTTKQLRKAIMRRSRLKKIYNKTRSPGNWDNYKKQGNFCVDLHKTLRCFLHISWGKLKDLI